MSEKPCPFCNSDRHEMWQPEGQWDSEKRVQCLGCGALGPEGAATEEEAREKWNTRRGEADQRHRAVSGANRGDGVMSDKREFILGGRCDLCGELGRYIDTGHCRECEEKLKPLLEKARSTGYRHAMARMKIALRQAIHASGSENTSLLTSLLQYAEQECREPQT